MEQELKNHRVLDHGYVRYIEGWGRGEADLTDDLECGIIEAARQSTQGSFRGWEVDEKLLGFLFNSEPQHSTPFEFAGMVIEVQAPIFVFREWHRHRTQCLAGDSVLTFSKNTRHLKSMTIEKLVSRWNPKLAKRERRALNQTEFNRNQISALNLRGPDGTVHITDAWYSGEKPLFKLVTKYGELIASPDHLFQTPEGSLRLGDSPKQVMSLVSVGSPKTFDEIQFTSHELLNERWKEIAEGYEISDLGRVKSHWGQGARIKSEPFLKTISINPRGRSVVNIEGRTHQVSHLVYQAFYGRFDGWILHIDDNPQNNRLSNLKLGDVRENSQDMYVNGGRRKLRTVPVEVLAIEKVGSGPTFDISVTGNHWFVANNLVVHNSYNEMSARYSPLPDLNYVPSLQRLMQGASLTNKQAGTVAEAEPITIQAAEEFRSALELEYMRQENLYQRALKSGVPKELARVVLPVGRYSRMRASTCLRNWLAFITLRYHPKAQWEIRQYAAVVASMVAEKFPRTWMLYKKMREGIESKGGSNEQASSKEHQAHS